jgi:phosphoglycolate phosphatase-like HAD superfamily hydrolase
MLIIFDVDGTLCDTLEVEGRCYVEAIEGVTGHSVASMDWSRFPEATSSAITQHLLSEFGVPNGVAVERLVLAEFVARLDSESRRRPDSFRPTAGALELFEDLKQREGYGVAIATGCWHDSAMLKLNRCGFMIGGVPLASSTDTARRADIISLAASRAGTGVDDAVYVGDGVWDLKAARKIGMRFVGVGEHHERLREHGASRVLHSFADHARFFRLLEEA